MKLILSVKGIRRYIEGRRMFNLYQHMKASGEGGKEAKEPETTGHDRFCQERPRSSYRRKKRRGACRRAQSAAELSPEAAAAARRRDAFRLRSLSTDRDDSEEESTERAPLVAQKIDSLAKLLFNKSIMGSGKSSPADTPASSPSKSGEKSMESSAALAICTDYLANTPRYELIAPLGQIGFRANKHWFAIHDHTIKTDRLLTLVPLPRSCGLAGGAGAGAEAERRGALLELLRALQHPYLLPVLELALSAAHALAVLPFNPGGSLKDLIYGSVWNEEYGRKYVVAKALPAWQVARFGRQLLEGLLFLHDKGFPPFRHLHTGNVMVQNGVARISGVESTLTGLAGRGPAAAAPQLGAVLLEMCACSRADTPFLPDAYQPVVEIVDVIFGPRGAASGAGGGGAAGGAWGAGLAELLMCDAFRKIDLREMKGSCLPNFNQRLSRSCLSLLESVSRRGAAPATPPPRIRHAATPPARRRHYNMEQDFTEEWGW